MKGVSISAAKNNLSALVRTVRAGGTITITDRGIPVARLVGPARGKGIPAGAVELAQRGVLMLPESEPSTQWAKGLPRPRLKRGTSALKALLEERDSGW
jgi:prevent-host-death family protein